MGRGYAIAIVTAALAAIFMSSVPIASASAKLDFCPSASAAAQFGATLPCISKNPGDGSQASTAYPPPLAIDGQGPTGEADELRDSAARRIPGQYIVVLEDSVERPGTIARAQAENRDGDLGFVYGAAIKGYSVSDLSKADVEALRQNPKVKSVTADYEGELFSQTTPTGIERSGALENATSDIDGKNDAPVNVDVAVIDTGVDPTHPDLNVYKRANCVPVGEKTSEKSTSCTEGTGSDGIGHGTHVAGTIGAIDNGEGVVGVAPGARIWSVRVFNNAGGTETALSWWIAGINWVTAHSSEIEVANMSFGCSSCFQFELDPLEEAVSAAADAGVVMVAAAGNDGAPLDQLGVGPAQNPDVITVAAISDYDGKAGGDAEPLYPGTCDEIDETGFLNWGSDDTVAMFSNGGPLVEVAAPGVCILSTIPGGKYGYSSGTSMASPHIAGAAALLASKSNPNNKAATEAIRTQIVDEGSHDWTSVWSRGDQSLGTQNLTWGWSEGPWDEIQGPLLDLRPQAAATYTTRASQRKTNSAELNGGVNPNGVATSYQFEYGTTEAYGSKAPASPQSIGSGTKDVKVSEAISSLKTNTPYHYRLVTTSSKGTVYGKDKTFTGAMTAFTHEPGEIEASSVELHGRIYPSGLETTYQFEYVEDATFEESGWSSAAKAPASAKAVSSGEFEVPVSEVVNGIKPETTYHSRLKVINENGTVNGADQGFTTPVPVLTTEATRIDARRAHLEGSVNPGGNETTYQFEWGRTTQYGQLEPVSAVSVGSGYKGVGIGREIKSLSPGVTYHYRVAATDQVTKAVTYGEDRSFTTSNSAFVTEGTRLTATLNGPAGIFTNWKPNFSGFAVGCHPFTLETDTYIKEGHGDKESISTPGIDAECILGENSAFPFSIDTSDCELVFHPGLKVAGKVHEGTMDIAGAECDGIEIGIDLSFSGSCELTIHPRYGLPVDFLNITGSEPHTVKIGMIHKGEDNFEYTQVGTGGFPPCEEGTFADGVMDATWTLTADEEGLPRDVQVEQVYPVATTKAASGVGPRGANLHAVIDTAGSGTLYGFEYGLTAAYGSQKSSFVGGSGSPVEKEIAVSGLKPSTTYHFRAFADNEHGGRSYGGDETFTTLAGGVTGEATNITTNGATLNASVDTDGGETSYQFEYGPTTAYGSKAPASPKSIGSGKGVLAVSEPVSGLSNSTTYHYRVAATNPEGTTYGEDKTFTTFGTWSLKSTPNPTPPPTNSNLKSVSCPTSSLCLAAGVENNFGKGFGQSWNGSAWKAEPALAASTTKFQGVSCPAEFFCMAVGYQGSGSSSTAGAESWGNFGEWESGGEMSLPQPSGGSSVQLTGVSCSSIEACTAVGSYSKEGKGRTLAMRWNGESWSIQTTANPETGSASLSRVSCPTSSFCMATGGNEGKPITESWNGTSWSLVSTPAPSPSKSTTLQGVSCTSSTSCTAVGSYTESEGANAKTLVERWNGTSWSIQSSPNPSGHYGSVLNSVSCTSSTSCTAVGHYFTTSGGGEWKTLAESWNGTEWAIQSSPNPEGKKKPTLAGVSCTSATSCTAVGSAQKGTGEPETVTLGERYE